MAKGARAEKRKRVSFSLEADSGSEVYVAGSFNSWDPKKNKLDRKNDVYRTSVLLSPGKYEYKFVVDGQWSLDPQCPQWAPNSLGSLNSVLTVE